MCELFAMSSKAPTNVSFSLHIFAEHGGGNTDAIDGWGLAFYEDKDVRLYKEPEHAAESDWVTFIEQRRLRSDTVLSHIRRATQGAISLSNTQPFLRELGGRMHAFAHNGRLAAIDQRMARRWRRFQPIGQTDSEIAFCILLESLSPLWAGGGMPSIRDRISILRDVATALRGLGPANFIYTDGDALFAHGDRRTQRDGTIAPPGLFSLRRSCAVDDDAAQSSGIRIASGSASQTLTLVASVPLTDEPWQPLVQGEVIAIQCGQPVDLA